ncbi:slime mold cyclic AMP receptor-domain-containing protein [Globomyces pollinis-pini]|nr:slime mold cyclic AMP receptor-domain-containing protein [Globomyces pollinis-pini]
MSLTKADLSTINVVVKVSSVVGFLGVCGMLYFIITSKHSFRNPTGRLIIAITVTDLFDSCTKFIGRWGPESGINSFLCRAQAFSIQEFNLANVTLGLIMGLNTVYLVLFRGSVDKIQKYEPYMIAFSFTFPLFFAIYPVATSMVGDVDTWCWIGKPFGPFQIGLWFGILWVIFCANIVVLSITAWSVKKLDSIMAASASSKTKSFGPLIIKRMVAYLIAFLIIWTPSSVNRMSQLIAGRSFFPLALLQALVSPTRGFINFMAYFYTWWHSPAAMRDRKFSHSVGGSSGKSNINLKGSKQGSSGNIIMSKSSNSISNGLNLDKTIGSSLNNLGHNERKQSLGDVYNGKQRRASADVQSNLDRTRTKAGSAAKMKSTDEEDF